MGHWFHKDYNSEEMFTLTSKRGNGKDWPDGVVEYEYLVGGPLATRIRNATNSMYTDQVILYVKETDGGYSEYTQETDYYFEVRVNGMVADFHPYSGYSRIDALSRWLDENEGTPIEED